MGQFQQEHIYHTLDPEDNFKPKQSLNYDTLGKLEVMLPNGKMVPATLVRNVTGRIVPLVDMDSPERRVDHINDIMSNSPLHSQPHLTPQQKYCLDNIDNSGNQAISPVHGNSINIPSSRNQTSLLNGPGISSTSPPLMHNTKIDFHHLRNHANTNRQFL